MNDFNKLISTHNLNDYLSVSSYVDILTSLKNLSKDDKDQILIRTNTINFSDERYSTNRIYFFKRDSFDDCKRVEDGFGWRNNGNRVDGNLHKYFYKHSYTNDQRKVAYEDIKIIKKVNLWLGDDDENVCGVHYVGSKSYLKPTKHDGQLFNKTTKSTVDAIKSKIQISTGDKRTYSDIVKSTQAPNELQSSFQPRDVKQISNFR